MKPPLFSRVALALALVATAGSLRAADESGVIHISDQAKKTIPIAVSGFSGESAQVLKFDLEVAGFDFVPVASAQYELKGSSAANLQGTLSDTGNHHTLFARACDPVLGLLKAQGNYSDEEIVGFALATCFQGLAAR